MKVTRYNGEKPAASTCTVLLHVYLERGDMEMNSTLK